MHTKALKLALAGVAAMVTLVVVHPKPANADPTKGRGAFIIREDGVCAIPGDIVGYDGPIVMDVKDVQNVGGGENFRCDGEVPAGFEPRRAFAERGSCTSPFGEGTGNLVITPGGNVSLTCHIAR